MTETHARESQRGVSRDASRFWPQVAVAVSGFLVLAIMQWRLEPSALSGDWAQYVLHARALLEGRPYTDTGYIFTPLNWPIGPRAYPPGLPLTLVPLVAAGDWAPSLMRLLMVVSGALFVVVAYLRLRQSVDSWVAALAALWCGVMLEVAYASVSILSDLGFCLLCWTTIWLVDRQGRWSHGRIALVVLAGLAAMSYRVAGVALCAALVPYVLVNRGEAGRAARIVLATWASLFVVAALLAPQLIPRLTVSDGAQMMTRVMGNLRTVQLALAEAQGYPFASNTANDAFHLVATLVMLIGTVGLLRRSWRSFLVMFTAVYAVMLLLAPVGDMRYWWPLFPMIVASLLEGVRLIAARAWRNAGPPRLAWATALVATVVLVPVVLLHMREEPPRPFSGYPDAVALSAFVRDGGISGEVRRVAFINPRVLTLYTGVPAMGLLVSRPSAIVAELERRGITHVINGSFTGGVCTPEAMDRAARAYPGAFTPVRSFGRFSVSRFTPVDSATLAAPAVADESPLMLNECPRP